VGSERARALALRAAGGAQEVVLHRMRAHVPGCLAFVVNTHIGNSQTSFRNFVPKHAAA